MSIRDALRKAAGLLVELPPEPPSELPSGPPQPGAAGDEVSRLFTQLRASQDTAQGSPAAKTVDQIVRESGGPNLDEIKIPTAPPPAPDGSVDLTAIYKGAGLPPSPLPAEQIMEMLASLPPELPLETRRQTVKAAMNAMGKPIGASPETVVADASRKLAALSAYTEHLSQQTTATIAETEKAIAALQSQIEGKRQAIETAKRQMGEATQRCEAESHRLDEVLEFFSLDVPPSRHSPPSNEKP